MVARRASPPSRACLHPLSPHSPSNPPPPPLPPLALWRTYAKSHKHPFPCDPTWGADFFIHGARLTTSRVVRRRRNSRVVLHHYSNPPTPSPHQSSSIARTHSNTVCRVPTHRRIDPCPAQPPHLATVANSTAGARGAKFFATERSRRENFFSF